MQDTYGVREFHILDDSFNIDMPRAKRIFDMIIENGMDIKISFPNGVGADFFDDEMVEKMSAAGVYRLALGIESGSLRIQKMISKSLDIGILKDVVKKLTNKLKGAMNEDYGTNNPNEPKTSYERDEPA